MLPIILVFYFLVGSASQIVGSLTFANTSINSLTNAILTISRSTNITISSAILQLQFPSYAYSNSMLSTISCNISCSINNLTLTINNLSLSNSNQLQLQIKNIKNPGSNIFTTYLYQVTTNSTTLETCNITVNGFTSGTIQSCTVTFSPNLVRKISTAYFSILPSNPFLTNGSLVLTYPSSWVNTINNQPVLNVSAVKCNSTSPIVYSSFGCSSLLQNQLDFINIFNTTSSSSLNFTVYPVLSLPLTVSQNSVSVMSIDQYGNIVDNFTICSISIPNPNVLANLSITSSTSNLVSTPSTISLAFNTTDLTAQNDVMKISIICSDISAINMNTPIINTPNNYSSSLSLQSALSSTNVYGYYLPRLSLLYSYVNSSTAITISNLTVSYPITTRPTTCLNISFYRSGAIYSSGNAILTATCNTLVNVTMSSNTSIVNSVAKLTINLTTASPLSNTSYIIIILPPSLSTTNYTKPCPASSGVSSNVNCNLTSYTLNVSNIFSSNVTGNKTISITFDGIVNPPTTQPTTNFTITTYYDYTNPYAVDNYTALVYQATADTITNCSLLTSNYTVAARSTYTIKYVNKNALPNGSYILITIPTGLAFSNTSVSVNYTLNSQNTSLLSLNVISFNNLSGINLTSLFSNNLTSNNLMVFTIQYLNNPNSTLPSTSFGLYSFYQSYLIESVTSGLTITMTTPAQFQSASVIPNSLTNGNTTFYTLNFSTSVNHTSGSIFLLTVPSQIILLNPICTSTLTIVCSLTSNILSIILSNSTNSIWANTAISIIIQGFTNSRTFDQTSPFFLNSSYNNGFINTASISGLINTNPNYILNFTSTVINPTQSYLNSSQSIFFSVTSKNGIRTNQYLLLYFPPEYTYSTNTNSSLCVEVSLTCIPQSSNSSIIKIYNINNFTLTYSLNLTITGFISPSNYSNLNMTNYFQIYTFQYNNNPIDTFISNNYTKTTFTSTCNPPCRTCSNTSSCSTCYPSSLTPNSFLQNNTCVSQCSSGYYSSNQSCMLCVNPCKTCLSATSCLSCNTSLNLVYFNSSCTSVCPNGYLNQSSICVVCSSVCSQCSISSSNCTVCAPSKVFYNYSCLSACPTGYYNSSNICTVCDASCSVCVSSSTNCTNCSIGYFRSGIANQCSNTCPVNTVLYQGVCQCDTKCSGCIAVLNNCTACSTNYTYYYVINNTRSCFSACPSGTYANSLNYCTACPTGCAVCSQNLTCSSCQSTYSLFSGTCLSNCPLGYASVNSVCLTCTSPCLYCNLTQLNCTVCISNYSLLLNTCVSICPTYSISLVSTSGLVCTNCSMYCLTCAVSISNCTSCTNTSFSYGSNLCLAACPNTTVANTNKVCIACQTPCVTCVSSLDNCSSCLPGLLYLNTSINVSSRCASTCPSYLYLTGNQCIQCQTPCLYCGNTAYTCTVCISGYTLYGNVCSNQPIYTTRSIPVPFSIAAFVLLLLGLGAKYVSSETQLIGFLIFGWSILEICAIFTVLFLVVVYSLSLYSTSLILIISGLGLNYLLNLINLVLYHRYLKSDKTFKNWYKSKRASVCVSLLIEGISCILSHKTIHLLFSRSFGSTYLKAPLSHVNLFTPLTILNGIGTLSSICFIISSILIVIDPNLAIDSQMFMQVIDSLCISILVLICSIINLRKNDDYFCEDSKKYSTQQNYQNNQTIEDLKLQQSHVHTNHHEEEVVGIRNKILMSGIKKKSKILNLSTQESPHKFSEFLNPSTNKIQNSYIPTYQNQKSIVKFRDIVTSDNQTGIKYKYAQIVAPENTMREEQLTQHQNAKTDKLQSEILIESTNMRKNYQNNGKIENINSQIIKYQQQESIECKSNPLQPGRAKPIEHSFSEKNNSHRINENILIQHEFDILQNNQRNQQQTIHNLEDDQYLPENQISPSQFDVPNMRYAKNYSEKLLQNPSRVKKRIKPVRIYSYESNIQNQLEPQQKASIPKEQLFTQQVLQSIQIRP